MKVYQLVAAAVLRVGLAGRPLSWTELGAVFDVTKDSARHQLNRFKEKYNVVDADVVEGWNRKFLNENTPEAEKAELANLKYVPGDIVGSDTEPLQIIVDAERNTAYLDAANKEVLPGFWAGDEDIVHHDEDEPQEYALTVQPTKVESIAKPQIDPLKFLITPNVLIVVRDGNPLSIDKSHKNFEKIQKSLEAGEWQAVLDFIDLKNTLTKYSNGRVLVENGRVTLDGETVHGKVVQRLVNLLLEENAEALESLANFLAKCDENPDHRVVTRIYDFMKHTDLRTDKEGYILAYKVVRNNYLDKHSGTLSNKPGEVVRMKRNKVNPKDEETCSHGLHVAAKGYIPSFGSPSTREGGERVVLCRVHPKDFVSIPTDYNAMKARVCEYTVLKDVTELFCSSRLEDEGTQA